MNFATNVVFFAATSDLDLTNNVLQCQRQTNATPTLSIITTQFVAIAFPVFETEEKYKLNLKHYLQQNALTAFVPNFDLGKSSIKISLLFLVY